MAVFTSAATGQWSAGATWVGGVKPPSGAGNSIVIALGHVVTYDEAAGEYGDDTTTAITVNGTLKADRTVNTSLTCLGQIFTAAATTATIDWGRRSTADPIPAGITATLILNKSSVMANNKYGLFIADTSNFYACGATKSINSRITSSVSAGGTTCTVDDITGWAVGDNIILASSDGTANHYDEKTILTLTPGAGTTGTITFAATSFAHASNCPIGNRTGNVNIKNFNTTNWTFVCLRHTSTASNNRREVDYVVFERTSSNSGNVNAQILISGGTSALCTPLVTFSNCFFYNGGGSGGATIFINAWNSGNFAFDKLAFFDTAGSSAHFNVASGTNVTLKNSVFYYSAGVQIQSNFSQGGQGCAFIDNTHCAINSNFMVNWSNGDGGIFTRCGFHTGLAGNAYMALNCGTATFTNCNFGYTGAISGATPALWGTPSAAYIINPNTQASKGEWTMTDCYFITPSISFVVASSIALVNPQWITKVANKNLDPLVQEIYSPPGTIVRDNNSIISGVTSLLMTPQSATNALTFTLDVPAPNGQLVGVNGVLRRVTTSNTVTVTLSGLGITPSVYTASAGLATNETFFVSGTNTSGSDGILTLTFSITGTTGSLYVDNISAPQAAAINFGEFNYWTRALPVGIVAANYVSPADIWNYIVDGATSAQASLRLYNAVLGGKVSGASTGTETFRDIADTKNRIVATVDINGNRTAITRDLT